MEHGQTRRCEASDPDPPDGYGPGSFSCHEALDRVALLERLIDNELGEHPAIKANPAWLIRVETVCTELAKLYQEIGSVHLIESPLR
jgi:hypothetical protein